ncbi:hypothetical protein [Pararhizobium arenae]|uniref:hypothetical protein n=1 Tax=Pararhizobium arenae TaxID=1856850 RepID=UPI00094AB036|nr:hypothetical protein [Pararhizobium arenae]
MSISISTRRHPLPFKRAVVLERDLLFALNIEADLKEFGLTEVRSFPTNGMALTALVNFQPDIALIDTEVTDGTTDALRVMLEIKGIPMVIVSHEQPEALGVIPWLPKTYHPHQLLFALETVEGMRKLNH